jgi:hypothetical protein
VGKYYYGINIVTYYLKKNEYQNGGSCNPLAPELNAYSGLQMRHNTTNWKVVGSIHDGVAEIFN